MAQRGASVEIKRFAFIAEVGGVRGTNGTVTNPTAYSGVSWAPMNQMLTDGRQLGSRKSVFENHIGRKDCEFSFSMKLTENTMAGYGPIFAAALGKTWANVALTLNAGVNTASTGTISAGVPDPIVKVEYNSGLPDYLPVKSYTGTTITWAITSRIGARTATAYKNALACAGNCYQQDPTADYASFKIECDQGSEPNDMSYQLQGMVPTVLELDLPLQDRAGFNVTMKGCDFDDTGAATTANVIEHTTFAEEFLGWVWDVNIQDLTTPVGATQQPLVALSGCNLAPTWIENVYAAGRAAAAVVQGSPVSGWKQGVHFTQDLVITVDVTVPAWLTAFKAGTKYQIFLTGYSGNPSAAPNARVLCLWFPECILNTRPAEVDVNGIVAHQLSFCVKESLDVIAGLRSHCAVAFFNS